MFSFCACNSFAFKFIYKTSAAFSTERRRLGRISERQAGMTCLRCRQTGHGVKECPNAHSQSELEEGEDVKRDTNNSKPKPAPGVGICYRYLSVSSLIFKMYQSNSFLDVEVDDISSLAVKKALIQKTLSHLLLASYAPKQDILHQLARRTKERVYTPTGARARFANKQIT